jgi:hypothetical protein
MDESFYGGREGNKHANKRIPNASGAVGKTAVWGVNTGVKVHQRIAVKIHQPEEEGSGVWPLEGGARGGLPPRRVIEDLI